MVTWTCPERAHALQKGPSRAKGSRRQRKWAPLPGKKGGGEKKQKGESAFPLVSEFLLRQRLIGPDSLDSCLCCLLVMSASQPSLRLYPQTPLFLPVRNSFNFPSFFFFLLFRPDLWDLQSKPLISARWRTQKQANSLDIHFYSFV